MFTPRWWPSAMLTRTRSERASTATRTHRCVAMRQSAEALTGKGLPYYASFPLYSLGLCPRDVALSSQDSPGSLRTLPLSLGKWLHIPSLWVSMLASQCCGHQVAGAAKTWGTTTCPVPVGPRLPSAARSPAAVSRGCGWHRPQGVPSA